MGCGVIVEQSWWLQCLDVVQLWVILRCSGTVCQRWRPLSEESKCDIEIVLRANHVLVTNEQRSRVLITQELVSGDMQLFLLHNNHDELLSTTSSPDEPQLPRNSN